MSAKALAKMARMYLDDGNVLVAEQTVQKALELDPLCDDLIKTEEDGTSKLYPIQIYYCKNCRPSKTVQKTI